MGLLDIVKTLTMRVSRLEQGMAEMKQELTQVNENVQRLDVKVERLDDVADTLARIYGLLKWVSAAGGSAAIGALIRVIFDRLT